MTTNLIRFPRPEGRPSNAALQSEVRALRHAVATISDERDELDAELTAWVDERVRAASETVALLAGFVLFVGLIVAGAIVLGER